MPQRSVVRWPPGLDPEKCPVHALNELRIEAEPERIWAWLVRAPLWPTFYANARRVMIESAPGPDLGPGVVFAWTTFGLRMRTTITEWEPPFRLTWRGARFGAEGCHGWVIEPVTGGCRVVTEEVQRGVLPALAAPLLRRALHRGHSRWLEGLERVATAGPPPAV